MKEIFKEKRMAAVSNSKPGDVDTSDWFNSLSERGLDRKEDPKSIMKAGKIILNIETKVININPDNDKKKVSVTIN